MARSIDAMLAAARAAARRGEFAQAQLEYLSVLEAYPANARARAALAELDARLAPTYAALSPPHADLAQVIGALQQGHADVALARAGMLLAQYPAAYFVHTLAGAAYEALGAAERAAECFAQALAIKPDYADGHFNLANVLAALDRPAEAEAAYTRALALRPDHAASHHRLGALFARYKRHAEAEAALRKAAALNPDDADMHVALGDVLLAQRNHPEAAAAYRAALARDPGNEWVRALMLFQQAMTCDWSDYVEGDALAALGTRERFVPPFALLSFDDDPHRALARARIYSAANFPAAPDPGLHAGSEIAPRIRIGYVSADFYDHPVTRLLSGVLRSHDRTQFEVVAYAYGPPRRDAFREQVERSVDRFVDLGPLDDDTAVARVRADRLDIAVHLNGHTGDTRSTLFARRLAPVQVNYLGYPGTMGASFIDYMVADADVVPPSARDTVSEALITLPRCFQPNDDARRLATRVPTRAECGLPEDGFVFVSFNNVYKIKPREWDVWMRLLDRVPGSVLWLSDTNRWAKEALAREAQARGIAPERVVFADRVDYDVHLARQQRADLFLDTFAYNAHTTASDALWAGLPLVTLEGRGFAARVAASTLRAVGLPELITTRVEDYEALALALARAPARLAALRARLAANLASAPLFDTAGYTRDLEAAFAAAVARHREGLPPADIALPPA